MEWLPIETLRRACVWAVLWHPDFRSPVVVYTGTRPGDYRDEGYTHWMPLPPPPKD